MNALQVREEPGKTPHSLQQRSNGTLPLGQQNPATTQASASTHARLSQRWQRPCTHEHGRRDRNSLWLTYRGEEQQRAARIKQREAEVASSELGLLQKSSQQKTTPTAPNTTSSPCFLFTRLDSKDLSKFTTGSNQTRGSGEGMSDSLRLQPPSDLYHSATNTAENNTSALKVDLLILTGAVLATVRVVTHLLV